MIDRKDAGLKKFNELAPEGAEEIKALLADMAPDLYRQVLEIAFGDLYQRSNLDPKIRQTVSLVALAVTNRENELRIHIQIAKTLGFTTSELVEVFSQVAPFGGFPSAMMGIRLLKEAEDDD